ncbi:uncharacterized protein LOC124912578 [Impatiens glandulifera]|uniref:uncharacterized protein LOC124912578 n=1 Tax=Impatiens glandulifera TaxID=253017 RepID=UPI001FB0E184|nr:uncharacterized protein LOC124912578 [Impatiens glandulifera]
MKNTIRCCISCILPCGSLDVIRIVHSNGKVEEITGNHVRAADIIKSYPNHVLKKPNSSSSDQIDVCGTQPKIVIVPPAAELRRGNIYFLIPVPPVVSEKTAPRRTTTRKKKKKAAGDQNNTGSCDVSTADRYLTDITSEKLSVKRRGRAGVWRPHLESITETATDIC